MPLSLKMKLILRSFFKQIEEEDVEEIVVDVEHSEVVAVLEALVVVVVQSMSVYLILSALVLIIILFDTYIYIMLVNLVSAGTNTNIILYFYLYNISTIFISLAPSFFILFHIDGTSFDNELYSQNQQLLGSHIAMSCGNDNDLLHYHAG